MGRRSVSLRFWSLLSGLCFLLYLGLAPGQAATISIAPIADTYIYSGEADTGHGSAAGIVTGFSVFSDPYAYAYLQFDLSAASGSPVLDAVLWLYQVDGNHPFAYGGTVVYRMSTNAWTEASLTWNNAPASSNLLFGNSADNGAHSGWTAWTWTSTPGDPNLDPTPSDSILSLFVTESFSTAQGHVWLSRDYSAYPDVVETWGSGKSPVLVLTTQSSTGVPEPATLFLTGGALSLLGWCLRRASNK
jgi:hypothetical protein